MMAVAHLINVSYERGNVKLLRSIKKVIIMFEKCQM